VQGVLADRRRQRFRRLRLETGPSIPNSRPLAAGSTPLTAGCELLIDDCFARGWRHRECGKFIIPSPQLDMATTTPKAERPAEKEDATSSANAGNKPAFTVRRGNVSAAVFVEGITLPSGKVAKLPRVSLRRSYQDRKSGEWKHSHTFNGDDLLPVMEALTECHNFIEAAKCGDDE